MKTKMTNRILSGLLALTMVFSLLPAGLITPASAALTHVGDNKGHSCTTKPSGSSGAFNVTMHSASGGADGLGNYAYLVIPDASRNGQAYAPSKIMGSAFFDGNFTGTADVNTNLILSGTVDPENYYYKDDDKRSNYSNSGDLSISGKMTYTFAQAIDELKNGNYTDRNGNTYTGDETSIPMIAILWSSAGPTLSWFYTDFIWDSSELALDGNDIIYTMPGADASAAPIDATTDVKATGGSGTLAAVQAITAEIFDNAGVDVSNEFQVALELSGAAIADGGALSDNTYTLRLTSSSKNITSTSGTHKAPYTGTITIRYLTSGGDPKTETINVTINPALYTATTISYSPITIRVRKGDTANGISAALLSVSGGVPTCTWRLFLRGSTGRGTMGIRPEAMYTATGAAGLVGTYVSLNGPVTVSGTPTRIAQAKHNNQTGRNATAWESKMPKDTGGNVIVDMEATPITLGTAGNITLLSSLDNKPVGTYSDLIELKYFTVGSANGNANITAAPTPPTTEATTGVLIAKIPITIEVVDADSVVFRGNGGTWGSDTYKTVTIKADGSVDYPGAPSRTGYTFKGWFLNKGTSLLQESDIKSKTNHVNGDYYTAQWEQDVVNYTVAFDLNDGGDSTTTPPTNDYPTQTVTSGGKATKPTPDPTRSGYKFKGWYKEPGCTTAWNFATDTVTSNITLYAKWTLDTYNVKVNVHLDDRAYSGYTDKVWLSTSDTTFADAGPGGKTVTSGVADMGNLAPGTYYIWVGASTGSKYTNVSVTVSNKAETATVDYYTVTAAKDATAKTAYVGASANPTSNNSMVFLSGDTAYLAASPAIGYAGNANWAVGAPSPAGGTLPGSIPAGNATSFTVTGSTIATASYTMDNYTAQITLWENSTSGNKVTASSVSIGNAADGSGATPMTETSSGSGVWQLTPVLSNVSYQYVTIVVDGGTYTVDLAANKIQYSHTSENVVLYKLTLEVASDPAGSNGDWGSATVTAGKNTFTATKAANNVIFHVPQITDAVELTSTAPAKYYTNATKLWKVNSADKNTKDKITPSAETTIIATFVPHGGLEFTRNAITGSAKEGYSAKTILTASTDGTKDDMVKNVGPGVLPNVGYTLTATGSTSWDPATALTITGLDTVTLDAAGGTKPWSGVEIVLNPGLTKGNYTANLTISSTDSNADPYTLTIPIEITISEGSVAEAKGNQFTWDTYIQEVTVNNNPAAKKNEWTTNIQLDDISDIQSVTYGSKTLRKGTDYTVGTKVAASGGTPDYIPVTFTETGLKELQGLIVGGKVGYITVTAKDSSNALKPATVTMNLDSSMPSLTKAEFQVSSAAVTEWTLGSGALPTLVVTDSNSATPASGSVTYTWYLNGARQSGWTSSAPDSAYTPAVGNVLRVVVKGKATNWYDAKPTSGDSYMNSVEATFKVVALAVTVKIQVDSGSLQDSTSTEGITAGKTVVGSKTLLTTATPDAKKYVFVNWTVATAADGTFGDATSATTLFTPAKATTVVAHYKSIATLEYTKGTSATGPNPSDNTKYTDTLHNAGAATATIKKMELTGSDAGKFTLAPVAKDTTVAADGTSPAFTITPGAGAVPGTTYTLTVETTYDGGPSGTGDVVKQTVVYTVPIPEFTITLVTGGHGTVTGNNRTNTVKTSSTANDSKTLSVPQSDLVTLTGTADKGYKFDTWELSTPFTGTDALLKAATDASNAYGPVTAVRTITGKFKEVTDLSENHTKNRATAALGYASAADIYVGAISNAGALAAGATYTLGNFTKDGTPDSTNASKFKLSLAANVIGTNPIDAAKDVSGTWTPGTQTLKVTADPGLPVGTYTMTLTIEETTGDANTMAGKNFTTTVDLVFIVSAQGIADVEVKLGSTYKNAERVDLKPASGAVVSTTPDATNNVYHATTAVVDTTYNVLVNGVGTGVTVKAVASTGTANKATVQLWTLTTAVDNAANGSVSVSGGTKVTVTGGTTGGDYVDGSSVSVSAFPATGKHFEKWEDLSTTKLTGSTWNSTTHESTTNPETIAMTADRSVKAHFANNDVKDTYYNVIYKDSDGSTTLAGPFTVKDGANHAIIPDPSKAGYTFLYWTSDFDSNHYKNGDATYDSVTVTNNIVFTANWVADPTWPTLRDGVYGKSYTSAAVSNSGCTYAVAAGSATMDATNHIYNNLPDGLSINTSTGVISGTPAETGTYHIKLTITHTASSMSWTRDYAIFIDKATPALSGININGVADNALISSLTIDGAAKVPFASSVSSSTVTWKDSGNPIAYNYVKSVGQKPTATTGDAEHGGTLAITSTTSSDSSKLVFGSSTTLTGEVTFTPSSSNATGYTGTHQTAQKYSDIYKTAKAPCGFNLGGKTYTISVVESGTTNSYKNFPDADMGAALPTAATFDTENKGNQDVYVTYELDDSTANFTLTPKYNVPSGTATHDHVAVGSTTNGAFTIVPTSTAKPGVYTVNVLAKVYDKASGGTLQGTVTIPVKFEVKATQFDGKVAISLNKMDGTTATHQQEPRGASVVFQEYDGTKLLGTTITGAFTGTVSSNGHYTAKLNTGTTYHVVVNGFDTGVTVTDNTEQTVGLYEVVLDAKDAEGKGLTAAVKAAIKALQSGPSYLAAGESGSYTTPAVYTDSTTTPKDNYDFTQPWQTQKPSGSATADASLNSSAITYTMPKTSPSAITLLAPYTKRDKDQVKVIYHSNLAGDNTSSGTGLWTQTVDKGVAFDLFSTVPTHNGFVFTVWNTESDNSGTAYTAGQKNVAGQSADMHLYAQWVEVAPATGISLPKGKDKTYYSERYTASIAPSSWVQKGTSTAVSAPAVKYQIASGALPGGLYLDPNTGVISGRPYQVDNGNATNKNVFTFKIEIVTNDTAATKIYETPDDLTITVDKETPRLANAKGQNATTGSAFSTGTYYADVVADILKTKGTSAATDVWEDGRTIIKGGDTANKDLYYKGASTFTPQADGGKLEPDSSVASTLFKAGANTVKLTWTPGDTSKATSGSNNAYPLVDGNANKWGDIFKSATADVSVTTGSDSRGIAVTPATIKFRVKKGSGAYEVWNGTAYVTPDGADHGAGKVDADNIFVTSTGNLPVYLNWALDPSTNTYFTLTASPANVGDRQKLAAKGDTHTLAVTAKYDTAVGTYTSEAVVTAYEGNTAADTTPISTQKVTLILEVVEADTFSFEVDTFLTDYGEDVGTPIAATPGTHNRVLGDLVSTTDQTAVKLLATDVTTPTSGDYVVPTRPGASDSPTGRYLFSLNTAKTYKVFVNGVEVPGVRINKSTTGPQKVDLYQLVPANDTHGTTTPAAAGYYLNGQRVSLTATGASGHQFDHWSQIVENGAVLDAETDPYSKDASMTYVMGDHAVKLTAHFSEVGKQFEVVLDANGGTLTYADSDYKNVISGGTKSTSAYLVNDGATFGLGMALSSGTPATGTKEYSAVNGTSTFMGWSIDKSATSGGYSFVANQKLADDDTATGADDGDVITLYAIWKADIPTLKLEPRTIPGTYKHTITPVSSSASGGTTPYTYSSSDFPVYTGIDLNGTTGKVTGTPDEVGTTPATVTVTDNAGATASATYTVIIDKAEVEPSGGTWTTPTIQVAVGGDTSKAIMDILNGVQMDGDGTTETAINGTWSIDDAIPTTAGTHTIHVTFHPTNATTDTAGKDHKDTKDGDHYKPYTATIVVTIGGKLITDADLDKGKTMVPAGGSALIFDVPTTAGTRSLDPNGHTGDPVYATATGAPGKTEANADVYIVKTSWTKNGVELASTSTPTADRSNDYALYITLGITDGSTWRFDPTKFTDSTIAGEKATLVAANDTIVVLMVNFPRQITVIDVSTNTPTHGTKDNNVWVPTSHINEYEITSYKWYESAATPATSGEVGSGAVGSEVKFDKDKFYDLVVTIKPKAGMEFSDAIKGYAAGISLNDCDGDNTDGDTATVNTKMPPLEAGNLSSDKRFVVVETTYTEANGLTIRYRAFQPVDQTLVGIRVEGTPGIYYAQTGDDPNNHFKTKNSTATPPTTGNTGSKDQYSFKFDFNRLKVIPLYKSADGSTVTDGTPLTTFTVSTSDGNDIPADGFKNGYDPAGGSAIRTDVQKFDGKTLVVTVDSFTAPVAGTLRVRELQATEIAKNATTGATPNLNYDLTGSGAAFDATAGTGLNVDVTFNSLSAAADPLKNGDPNDLTNTVTMTYAAYAANADNGTYFFEYGSATAPTFVPHDNGDPSTLGGALLNELKPSDTMTAAMKDQTLYATYVDVNHNIVRLPLGKITMAADFTARLDDPNGPDAEYGDTLVGTPLKPDGTTPVDDPGDYTYQWEYWKPGTDGEKNPDTPGANGTWEKLPGETNRTHVPGKTEVGEYIHVVVTDPKNGTSRPSGAVKVEPRSLNFDVKPWNKAPSKPTATSDNIHSYDSTDFTLTGYGAVGGVYGTDNVTLTPAGTWNDTANAGAIGTAGNNVNARPNYRVPTDTDSDSTYWDEALGGAVGDKITWPAITEDTTKNTVDMTGGYTLGGDITATSLNGTAISSVYRLRPQAEIPNRGTILSAEIDDVNDHDPEYGDTLTGKPTDTSGNDEDPDGNWDYKWEHWVPGSDGKGPDEPGANGTWEPIPGETGKTHVPGPDEVGEYIHVIITEPGSGNPRESEPEKIEPRSLNFVVARWDRNFISKTDASNTHTYATADFTLTPVKKDPERNPDKTLKIDTTTKMATFNATTVYGGVYGSDTVTLGPDQTAGNWNLVDATNPNRRPQYLKNGAITIAADTASGEVGSKITWPQVYTDNVDKNDAREWAGRFTDYVLTAPKNSAGKDIYRLAPQDEQLDRGEILAGGDSGNVMHVNVDFENYPALGGIMPNYPDSEVSNADGSADPVLGAVAVTDKRETRPGEVLKDSDDAHTGKNNGYPGNQYIAMWYTPAVDGDGKLAGDFDPTNPGTAINATNKVTVKSDGTTDTTNTVRPEHRFDGKGVTVVVKVIAREGYTYDLNRTDGKQTKFHFKFGTNYTVDLDKATKGPQGVRKVVENDVDGDPHDVYYMWYTFSPEVLVSPPFTYEPLDLGLAPGDFVYYANTESSAGANDHHYTVNTTGDNDPIPGGKQDLPFQYNLQKVINAINNGGAGTDLKRASGGAVHIDASNYGTTWWLKAGPTPRAATNLLNTTTTTGGVTTHNQVGITFQDKVHLLGSDGGTANVGNSGNSGNTFGANTYATYDGSYIYIRVNLSGDPDDEQPYPVPLGTLPAGAGSDLSQMKAVPLTVKELEAEEISAVNGSFTTALDAYTSGDTFSPAGITGATVKFNQGVPQMNVTYTAAIPADGQDITWTAETPTRTEEGKVFYFQYESSTPGTFVSLTNATTLNHDTHDGKMVYICYTDVNNHMIRKPLGYLRVKKEEAPGTISQIKITYPEPAKGETPRAWDIATGNRVDIWSYNTLEDASKVAVSTTVDSGVTLTPNTESKTLGSTWYTTTLSGAPADAAAIQGQSTAGTLLTAAFLPNKYYMVEAKITSLGDGWDPNGVTVDINGIKVKVDGTMGTKYDAGQAIGWAMAEFAVDNKGDSDPSNDVTYIIARYVAKTLDDTTVGTLTIGYTAPAKDGEPTDQKYNTDTNVADVTVHDTTAPTKAGTNQWYSGIVVGDVDDFAAAGKARMKFKNDGAAGTAADKYDYSSYYMVESTFTPKTGYKLANTTSILVDGVITVTAGGTVVPYAANLGKPGLQSAKATYNAADGTIKVQAIYLTENAPDAPTTDDVTDLYVNYRMPVTGAAVPSAPESWGNTDQADITDQATAPATGVTAKWYVAKDAKDTDGTTDVADAWTTNTAAGANYAAGTWYRAEAIFTAKTTGGSGAGYQFTGDQKIRINGVEVTVDGAVATIKDAADNVLGYVKAVWNNAAKTQIKAMYIAKTVDKIPVTTVGINYTMPMDGVAAAEYINYVDRDAVTVYNYGATTDHTADPPVDPDGTRWYPADDANDFTYTAGEMMAIGTTKYAAGKFYLVENIIHPNNGYTLSTNTTVQVDGHAVKDNNTATTITNTLGYGLMTVKKTLNGDGTITVQSIYKVRDNDPGKIGHIAITYPEPVKGKEPLPKRTEDSANTKRTYEYLSAHVKVNQDLNGGTSAPTNDTLGSRWYDVGTAAPTAANKTTIFDPTGKTYLDDTFGAGHYYMVEGTIKPKSTSYVFDSTVYVTINGILVEVADDLDHATMNAKYDSAGNAIGWAVAVKDGNAIKARYIAKTEEDDRTVIYQVEGTVTVPVVGQPINATRISDKKARFDNDKDATDNVNYSGLTWKKSTASDFSGLTDATGNFEAGYYYEATFTVNAKAGYTFQNITTPAGDFVAFLVNDVTKPDNSWINDKALGETATKNGITVTAERVVDTAHPTGDPDNYTITVRFPLTGTKADLDVYGYAEAPVRGGTVDPTKITLKSGEPYEPVNGTGDTATKWQHWNGTIWEDATSGNFIGGEYYRALITAKLKDDALTQNRYNSFTAATKGYVNDVLSADGTLNAAPTGSRNTKIFNADATITLAKEFRVDRKPVTVHISSKVPTAGAYAIDMDVKFYAPDTGLYTLADGTDGKVGHWYNDAAGTDPATVFEEGKTYYLITTADALDDNCFIDAKSGYQWVEHDDATGTTKQYEVKNRTDGDITTARAVFAYTIPVTPAAKVDIPGYANQPIRGQALGNIWTDENNFEELNSFWSTDEAGANQVPATTQAGASTTYYATIEVAAKPGVQVTDKTFFNGHGIDDPKFVTHKVIGQTADGRDIYRLVYRFDPTSSAGGGGGGGGGGSSVTVESPVVYYHLKDQGVTDDPTAEKVKKNNNPKKVPKVKPVTGLKFLGWSEVDPSTLPAGKLPTLVDPTTFKITADKWFYAVYEQGTEVDHLHYVIGFPNGTFGPDAKITRAEVATIIARSCLEGFVEGANYGNPGNYSDVTTHWAFSAIAFCAREGVFTGYEDGTFRPDRYITRQELATVVARLAGVQTSQGVPFNDRDQIASWAMNGVYTAYANGWINGYEDGTFQPERDISRAETVKIFNGYLKRGVDSKGLEGLKEYIHSGVASNNTENGHDEYMTWPDVPKTHWAYHEIIEAANDHNFHWQDEEKKTPPEDWDEVYIDEKWRYNDNASDGADKRDENMNLQKTFTVTYLVSSNGVTYDAITETVDRFASPKPENMPVAVPNEGYRFAGWSSTDPSTGTITLVDPTASSVTSDEWFYAVFEEDIPSELPVYTVTYVIGELGSYDGATVERVELYQAPSVAGLPQPTVRDGYRLAGWSETDPATGSYTIVDPTANYVTGDKTFYAVYEEADEPYQLPVYTVTYVIGENGSYDGATVEQVEMYQAPTVSGLPHPVANEGYAFVGWSETDPANGGYAIMDPTANYVTGDKTFYAVYEAI